MQESIVAKELSGSEARSVAKPLPVRKESAAAKPMLAGIVYGEIVFWIMLASLVIAILGLVIYLSSGGGYLSSSSLLDQLWRGSSPATIWKQVGNVTKPPPWYACFGMLSKGDMLATLGLAVTGIAAVVGMWCAFLVMLRSKGGIYIVFALIIAVVLTLSALGILSLQM